MLVKKVLATGKYKPENISVSVSESTRRIDQKVESQIDSIWQDMNKKAKEAGKVCYNGLSYRLNSIKKSDDGIHLDFGIIEYKMRDGIIKIPEYFNLPEEYYRKGCYTMATVKTIDDFYLMVELSGKSMNKNEIDLLGGIMETNIEAKTGADVFQSLFTELEEEACINKSDIENSYLRSVFLSNNTNVCLYFEITLKLSISELQDRFKKDNKDQDIKSLKHFSKEEYINTLKKHKSQNKQFIPEVMDI